MTLEFEFLCSKSRGAQAFGFPLVRWIRGVGRGRERLKTDDYHWPGRSQTRDQMEKTLFSEFFLKKKPIPLFCGAKSPNETHFYHFSTSLPRSSFIQF